MLDAIRLPSFRLDGRVAMVTGSGAGIGAGIATGLASTKDFRAFERHGIIFPPNNRDVTIFPEKIGGRFRALHRPCGWCLAMFCKSPPRQRAADHQGHERKCKHPAPGSPRSRGWNRSWSLRVASN